MGQRVKRSAKIPSLLLLLHKPSGQARVIINGKQHYLGDCGSPESVRKYDR